MTAAVQPLDPLRFPLHGQRLIEASAGTGKTFTIALLYLRLVLGHGGDAAFARPLTPPEILVVTFTEAATQELRERIRARLHEAARVFGDESESAEAAETADPLLHALRAEVPLGQWPEAAHRLRIAAQWMDEAAVATIHGWCWRMLREHAFDSGSLLQQTLQTDLRPLQRQAAHDHWRRHFYPLGEAASRALLRCFATPADLWRAVEPLLRRADAAIHLQGEPMPARDPVAELQAAGQAQQHAQALQDTARRLWREDRAALEQLWHTARSQLNGNSYRGKDDDATFAQWLHGLAAWAEGAEAQAELKIARFGLTGAKLRKGAALPAHPALQAIDDWQAAAGAIDLPALRAQLVAHAAREIGAALLREKARRAELSFDDLLRQLDGALHAPGGAVLAARIRQQFPIALIDEFQDTDPVQYRIFRRIYAAPEVDAQATGLVLIGDPKQAIYAFRGADIRTYLRARRATEGAHYVLGTNYRSTAAVVRAVNTLFQRAEAAPQGAFRFRSGDDDPVPFVPVQAQGRGERLQIAGAPAPALTLWTLQPAPGGASPGLSQRLYRAQMAEAAASAVVRWLQEAAAGRTGFVRGDGALQPLRPADIAVLVRSRTEADAIRTALAARGLPSVYLSDRESVFASPEATDLRHWLRACAAPGDEALLRTALATRSMALPFAELQRLREDELAWEALALRLRRLHALWQQRGVLPMLHQWLHDFGLPARWLAAPGGERRLTNVLHLAEWLQRRAVELDGEHALLRAFAERLADPEGEEDVLRLESDAALIQVVTIHKSKGLEYPLVLLPFIAGWREPRKDAPQAIGFHDAALDAPVLELDGQHDAAARRAAEEQLAEDLRLLYVALTRARHGLWLGVAPLLADARSKSIALHKGALGQLLGQGAALDTSEKYHAALQAVAAACDDIAVQPAPAPDAQRWQPPPAPATRAARRPRRAGHAPWWIASYSALVQQLGPAEEAGAPATHAAPEPEDARQDQALEAAAETAVETVDGDGEVWAEAPITPARAAPAARWHAFPQGAEPGSFLHGLLEWCAQQGFARVAAQPQALRDLIARRCAVRGWQAWIEPLCEWMTHWLQLPLPLPNAAPATLADLARYQCEMEFWLPVASMDTQQIDALACAHTFERAPRPPLAPTRLAGMLKGFIDLVFEHEGRYWVADYKSNWLGPDAQAYGAEALRQSLLAHRYDVQYLLYVFALHRLLRARLPDYDYERHVGGAVYLFLRGADAPTRGVFATQPPRVLIEALEALFSGAEAAQETAP